ncbi:DUF2304 family protein [Clostridium sp. MCC353]|uniref:DUF2304 domain-containing protein n=1 Tax=Clostridium sp. MCC353 TaxID=2592646 RepID=UPI001C02F413|nr:DUF2304 domain-containing protein [Clostridium sp. MCC353]MBT9778369.1 DUF2304 family protein [Clostridium sp. MCC353]
MMTPMLRVMLVLVSFGTLFLMMRKIRQAKVQIEAAIYWVIVALMLVVFSIFPKSADFLAHLAGVYSTANFLFLFVIFLLIIKVFYMTIHISQLETKLKDLVQRMALDEKMREDMEAGLEMTAAGDENLSRGNKECGVE